VPRSTSTIRFEHVHFRPLALPDGVHSELHMVWRDGNDNPALAAVRATLCNSAHTTPQGR